MAARKRTPAWNVYTATAAVAGLAVVAHLSLRGPDLWLGVTVVAAILFTDLGFTLAARRGHTATAPAPAIVRTPRLLELAAAEAHLLSLRTEYRAGRTSGHPEDALWDIEDAEKRVAKLRAGTD
jgi:hypothetical protein